MTNPRAAESVFKAGTIVEGKRNKLKLDYMDDGMPSDSDDGAPAK